MKKLIMMILFTAIFSNTSIAASSPPKGFVDEKIYTFDGNRLSWGEVGELVQCFKDGGSSTSWESAGNSWILHAKYTDKLTKKVHKTDVLFEYKKFKEDVNRVYSTRIIVDKKEIQPGLLLSSPNVMACWKKEIKEAELQSKRQEALDEEARIAREKEEEAKNLAEIEAAKAQAKQDEEIAAIEKQNAIKRLAGFYENKEKSKGKPLGNIKVDVISEDKIMLNLHIKNMYSSFCDIENQEAAIEYNGYEKTIKAYIGDKASAINNRNEGCFISLQFEESSTFEFIAELSKIGCKSYCNNGANMSGYYMKTPN